MKKGILALLGLIIIYIEICAQNENKESILQTENQFIAKPLVPFYQNPIITDNYDRIIKLNKDTLVVAIQKITQTEIVFFYPLNTSINRIPVYHVKEVIAKDGTPNAIFKLYSNSAKKVKNDTIPIIDYKSIVITFNEADIEGMAELGIVDSHSEGERVTSNSALMEKNAIFQLRKKAAQLGATKVLVTDKNVQNAYGENPMVEMKGVAYK